MRAVIRVLDAVSIWLNARFPEKLTAGDVMTRFVEFDERLRALEQNKEIQTLRVEVAKLKLLHGVQQFTGLNGAE
jgi:hypothetical protein